MADIRYWACVNPSLIVLPLLLFTLCVFLFTGRPKAHARAATQKDAAAVADVRHWAAQAALRPPHAAAAAAHAVPRVDAATRSPCADKTPDPLLFTR